MNSIKHKIMKNMTNEQKTILLLKIPYINLFTLQKIYKKNIYLVGGNSNYDKEYNNEYNNKSGKFNIELNNNKYYFKIERYSTNEGTKYEDKQFKFIDFITIKDKYKDFIDCGSISIDIKNKIATIISLGNDSKCLKSKNNIQFKYGDILFQIMLYICKKENINKIELTDNSYRKCGNFNLSLDYLKTLTHGYPHYYKYGFKFKYDNDNKILKDNYNNYKNDPKINKNKLLILLKSNNVNNIKIESIKKILNKLENDEISIKKFIKLYTLYLTNNENCELIYKIYIELFIEAKYNLYYTKDYILNL